MKWLNNFQYLKKLLCFFLLTIIICIQSSRSFAAFEWKSLKDERDFYLEMLSYTNSIMENDPELARRIKNLARILHEVDWDDQEIIYKPVHSNQVQRCYCKYYNPVSGALSSFFSELASVPSGIYVDLREKFLQINSRQSYEKIKDFLLIYSKAKRLNTHQKVLLSSCTTKVLVKGGALINPAAVVFHASYYRSPLAVFDTHCRGINNTTCIEYTTLALDLMKHLGVNGKRSGPTLGYELSAIFLFYLNVQGFLHNLSEGYYLECCRDLWLASFILFLCSTSGHQFCSVVDEDNAEVFVDPMHRCLWKSYGVLKIDK